jgi:hypothetical protein
MSAALSSTLIVEPVVREQSTNRADIHPSSLDLAVWPVQAHGDGAESATATATPQGAAVLIAAAPAAAATKRTIEFLNCMASPFGLRMGTMTRSSAHRL